MIAVITIDDNFSKQYRSWCMMKEVSPGTEAIKWFHKEKKCLMHDKCNYCPDGAMTW